MKIVAELGTSHNGSFEKAIKLIDEAKNCGADCVKFQWVYADEILQPNTGLVDLPGGKIELYQKFKSLEVAPDFFYKLREYCHKIGIEFMCSPFGKKSLAELLEIKPDYIKIASPELNYVQLLQELAQKNCEKIPIVLSSGVSKLCDIEKALSYFTTEKITLLHCITQYPAPVNEYNLRLITNLRNIFGVKTGVSDHSTDPFLVPLVSLTQNACMLEKHFTLDNSENGLDDKIALNIKNFKQMVLKIRQFENKSSFDILSFLNETYGKPLIDSILGDGVKKLAESEKQNYGKTNRSLRFVKSNKKGHVITQDDIGILRSEKNLDEGLKPEFLETLLGAKLIKDVMAGDAVSWHSVF